MKKNTETFDLTTWRLKIPHLNFNIAKVMSIDQLETQIAELDNLPEHREIVTFMRRSAPLNTSQRTALEQHRDLILEYPWVTYVSTSSIRAPFNSWNRFRYGPFFSTYG